MLKKALAEKAPLGDTGVGWGGVEGIGEEQDLL